MDNELVSIFAEAGLVESPAGAVAGALPQCIHLSMVTVREAFESGRACGIGFGTKEAKPDGGWSWNSDGGQGRWPVHPETQEPLKPDDLILSAHLSDVRGYSALEGRWGACIESLGDRVVGANLFDHTGNNTYYIVVRSLPKLGGNDEELLGELKRQALEIPETHSALEEKPVIQL